MSAFLFFVFFTVSLQSRGSSLRPVGALSPASSFSGPRCDGWAEEDPGTRASACSSSVLSSVMEQKKKNTSTSSGF